MRARRALGLAAVVLLLSVGCSDTKDTDTTDTADTVAPKDGPKITIGSANFSESKILAEIYAQGLKAKGYKTATKLNLGAREVYFPALEKGSIDFFPEYTGSALNFLTKQTDAAKPEPQETYDLLAAELKEVELTAFEMAYAQDKDGIVTNEETADKYSLEKVSDLKAHGSMLVMGGPPECKTRIACLKGLEEVYGIEFKEFKSLDAGGPQTIQALKGNAIQVANLFTTDARIAAQGFVVLEHDEPIVGAENVVPVVRNEIAQGYGDEFAEAVNAITAKLTTDNLTQLNKRVDIDKDDPDDVAGSFLRDNDLI
jgi:osmoprotectant transport system substrate-binding protein